jgi:LEA14-like dessication related protein
MQELKRTGTGTRIHRLAALFLLLAFVLAGTGCGPKVIKDRPPFVSISSMSMEGGMLATTFDIANQNGVSLEVDSTEIKVNVRDTELVRYDSQEKFTIGANSTEKITARLELADFTQTLLLSLDSGELDSLSIDLTGQVHTNKEGNLRFEQKGYLYRVPGRPGQFRSAVTQAKELVRDEPRYKGN